MRLFRPEIHEVTMQIATRYVELHHADMSDAEKEEEISQVETSIRVCHLNGTPLRLHELLAADNFNLTHDVSGIHNCVSRKNGKIIGHFLPRFYDYKTANKRKRKVAAA